MVMQNVGPVQSIAVMPCAAGMVAGACHADPLRNATWFRLGAAAQKPLLAHDRKAVPWGEGDGVGAPRGVTFSRYRRYVWPVVEPMTQEKGAGHDTTERFALAATLIALDHVPAGPAVVVVVARVVVVFVVGALDDPDPGDSLHPAAMKSTARAPRAAQNGLRPAG